MINRISRFFKVNQRFAIICAFFGSVLVSLSPIFVRYSEVNVATTAFFRFFFALPFIWWWMIFDQFKPKHYRNPHYFSDYFWLIASGVFVSLDIALWYLSMQYTNIVNSILLNNGCTVIVAIAAWLFLKEKMTWQIVIGIIMAIAGSTFLVGESFEIGNPDTIKGDLYALLSAVFYALFILVTKKLRDHFSTPVIMMWSGFSSVYTLGIIAVFFHESLTPDVCKGCLLLPVTLYGWINLISLSLFVHILGQGLISYSMAYLTATFSAIITLIGPVVGVIIGYYLFNENLSTTQIIGGIVIIFGIVLSQYKRKKYKEV